MQQSNGAQASSRSEGPATSGGGAQRSTLHGVEHRFMLKGVMVRLAVSLYEPQNRALRRCEKHE